MLAPREEWFLDTARLGRRVLVFDCLDSSNNLAARLADDVRNDGLAILCDEQTAGRGQHGRTWLADAGQSVLLSVIVAPSPHWCRPVLLTAWAAVSVCATIQQIIGRSSRIKWPNDVLLQDRKVCGILIESVCGRRAATVRERCFVVGIGLNVKQSADAFASAGLPEATSLAQCSGLELDTRSVAAALIRQLDRGYDGLCLGDLAALQQRWQEFLGLLGQDVVAVCNDAVHRGRLLTLSFDSVELASSGAGVLRLIPERIQRLSLADETDAS